MHTIKLTPGPRSDSQDKVKMIAGRVLSFSSRGARAVFGAVGVPFAWSRMTGESSTDGAEALTLMHERLGGTTSVIEVREEVSMAEASLAERLRSWRDYPTVLRPGDYEAALVPQPFAFGKAPPSPPDPVRTRATLEREISERVAAGAEPASKIPALLVVAGVVVLGAVETYRAVDWGSRAPTALPMPLTVAAVALLVGACSVPYALLLYATQHAWRWVRFRLRKRNLLQSSWPDHWREAERRHAEAVTGYERERAEAEVAWAERERERVSRAERVIRGEADAVEEIIVQSLLDLDVPHDTTVVFALGKSGEALILLDLPEIEDVIPKVRYQVGSRGQLLTVRRPDSDRNAEYAELACGIGLMAAAAAFAAAPALSTVRLAAYTQRARGRRVEEDEYVYEGLIPRNAFTEVDLRNKRATSTIRVLARMDQQADLSFKRIPNQELPDWVRSLR